MGLVPVPASWVLTLSSYICANFSWFYYSAMEKFFWWTMQKINSKDVLDGRICRCSHIWESTLYNFYGTIQWHFWPQWYQRQPNTEARDLRSLPPRWHKYRLRLGRHHARHFRQCVLQEPGIWTWGSTHGPEPGHHPRLQCSGATLQQSKWFIFDSIRRSHDQDAKSESSHRYRGRDPNQMRRGQSPRQQQQDKLGIIHCSRIKFLPSDRNTMNLLKDTRHPNHQIAGVTNLQEALANSSWNVQNPNFRIHEPKFFTRTFVQLLLVVVFIFGTEIVFWFSWNWNDPAYKNRWISKNNSSDTSSEMQQVWKLGLCSCNNWWSSIDVSTDVLLCRL